MSKTIEQMLFNNQMFSILTLKKDPNLGNNISDAYAYAWYHSIYPFFHDDAEWHKPYGDLFKISGSMVDEISLFFDTIWKQQNTISFYELEEQFKAKTHWPRSSLIVVCRYLFLDDGFSNTFWNKLCENKKCPVEAHSIILPFKASDLYLE